MHREQLVVGLGRQEGAFRPGQLPPDQQRLESAQQKAVAEWEEMAQLEAELTGELEEINDRWEALVDETEEAEIRLEKNDISVASMSLVWLPVE